jgi:transposase
MRRLVYDRSFVGSFNPIDALEGAKRRPALKKNSKSTRQSKGKTVNKTTTTSPKTTIGIDLGDQKSHYCILDTKGEVLSEGTVRTTENGFAQQFQRMPRSRIALETGTHSPWVSRLLERYGHEVIVANTRQVRAIYDNDNKTDKVDARTLALLARVDKRLLHPVRHRSAQAQADLVLLKARDQLVSTRTQLINSVRGMVKSVGGRLPSSSSAYFAKKVREHLPDAVREALLPLLEQIEAITARITAYDKKIEDLCHTKYPKTQLIRQIPSVGSLTSLAFMLTIDDPYRFQKSRSVGSYLGLRPRRDDSGASSPQLPITKAGNQFLRRLLIQCAQHVLGRFGTDTDLRRWGLSLTERGGKNARKRAVVAVARKLAVMMHSLWVTGEVYEPLRQANKLKTIAA